MQLAAAQAASGVACGAPWRRWRRLPAHSSRVGCPELRGGRQLTGARRAAHVDETVFEHYSENCVYSCPLLEIHGRGRYRAFCAGLHWLCHAARVQRPVRVGVWNRTTLRGEPGTEIAVDFVLVVSPVPFLADLLRLRCRTTLVLGPDGAIVDHRDSWAVRETLGLTLPVLVSLLCTCRLAAGLLTSLLFSLASRLQTPVAARQRAYT